MKLCDRVPTTELYASLGLEEISSATGTRRLRWYGHVCRSSGFIATVGEMAAEGKRDRGRPRKTWNDCVRNDRKDRDLLDVDPMDRPVWRSAVYARFPLPLVLECSVGTGMSADPITLLRLLERWNKWRGREAVDALERPGTNV